MSGDPLARVRSQVGRRVAAIRDAAPRLSPLDLHVEMDAIRELAAVNGLAALESLGRCSAQLALLPGHRTAIRACLDHMGDAIGSRSEVDCSTILAAVAVRLN